MKKRFPWAYLFLFVSLLTMLSLPRGPSEYLRGTTIAFVAPSWQRLLSIKDYFGAWFPSSHTVSPSSEEEIQKLRLDNILLQREIAHLKETVQREMCLLNELSTSHPEIQKTAQQIKLRRRSELQHLLQLKAIPARVIFRSPASWNSYFWINIGEEENKKFDHLVIAKNSPVVVGNSIIGVIDYVGNNQSRVMLITNSSLNPSVRVLRDHSKQYLANEKIQGVVRLFENAKGLNQDQQKQKDLLQQLQVVIQSYPQSMLYLAKGEINGSSKPLWRANRHVLKGIGFNYDFADGEGPGRDLRTGKALNSEDNVPSIPILKAGDLLVTTGMDGVFPPDLLVAEVTQVHMLKEGDYYYELDARPTLGNFDDISTVFVLPPISTEENLD